MTRAAVIGAGSSGLAALQVLRARGVEATAFETGSAVGGNWRYQNDNGMSAAYASLHINTSKTRMQYRAFPMPAAYPDYPHHTQIAAYFDAYADHFGLRPHIRFRTPVASLAPATDGWAITCADGSRETFDAVLVASGHHWSPRWPTYPATFDGRTLHAHEYRTPDLFEGRDVLVVGFGNSACDIAVESSRVARTTLLSVRRGAHVVPKYILGKPVDDLFPWLSGRLPLPLLQLAYGALLHLVQGPMEAYGLPRPDHRILEAHPTISSELLTRIGHGRIAPRPDVARLDGRRVVFVDGSAADVDVIVWCTGYHIRFPFLADDVLRIEENRVRLYRHVVPPDLSGLFFVGLIQPLGAIMPLAEAQAEWIADVLMGRAVLPPRATMEREITRDQGAMARRYVGSARHTIQVDYDAYLRTIARERERRA